MKTLLLWSSFLLYCSAISQSAVIEEGLKIGSSVPNIEIKNVINVPDSVICFDQFKDKLIIIDFWSTTCPACIKNFDRMDNLQKKFGNKIQIITVTKEPKQEIKAFFLKMKKLRIPSIPFVTGDTILSNMFPHVFVPHHVWIDQKRTVRFITDEWNLNDKNIKEYLDGKELALSEKMYVKNFSVYKPLLSVEDGKYLNSIDYYSFIGHCVSGITIGNRIENTNHKNEKLNRITQSCYPPFMLFKTAFSEMGKYNLWARNSIIFENLDSTDFIPPPFTSYEYDSWQLKNTFNYDLVIPESRSNSLFEIMQQDLSRYFDVEARIEKRKLMCYVLVRTSKLDKIKSKGVHSNRMHNGMSIDSLWHIHDITTRNFVEYLSEIFYNYGIKEPLIDGTYYKGNIDIGVSKTVARPLIPSNMNRYLKSYDLKIIKEERMINALVIRRKNK
jgi:thiol-disulfide isomerase/thioredoxin